MEFWCVFAAPLWISPEVNLTIQIKHGLYSLVEVIRQYNR